MSPAGGLLVVFALLASPGVAACRKETPPPPNPVLSPNAPTDKPVETIGKAEAEELRVAMAPYVQKARDSYPDAKKRYLAGLPAGHTFFAVTQLHDGTGATEQVFVGVSSIRDGRITGRIASDIRTVNGFKTSDPHSFPEAELVDWLITRPDGSEEGNVVGKFLDEWNDKKVRH